jgi:uncharacterized protein YxeA
MKKILLLALFLAIPSIVYAAVSVESATNPTNLVNNGYSAQTAEIVTMSKARVNAQAYNPEGEKSLDSQNKFVKFWKKFYVYADPAAEDYSFYNHDNNSTPTYTDL